MQTKACYSRWLMQLDLIAMLEMDDDLINGYNGSNHFNKSDFTKVHYSGID